jgi:hypothetical protein
VAKAASSVQRIITLRTAATAAADTIVYGGSTCTATDTTQAHTTACQLQVAKTAGCVQRIITQRTAAAAGVVCGGGTCTAAHHRHNRMLVTSATNIGIVSVLQQQLSNLNVTKSASSMQCSITL